MNTHWLAMISESYQRSWKHLSEIGEFNPIANLCEKIETAETESDCRLISSRLGAVAGFYAVRGVVTILESGTDGWHWLRSGAAMSYWEKRIRCRSFDVSSDKSGRKRWRPNIVRVAGDALLSIALKMDEQSMWLSERLDRSRYDDSIAAWNTWDYPTPRLVLALYRYANGAGTENLLDLNMGIYQQIFENWLSSGDEFGVSLTEAAQYHIENLNPRGKRNIAEFEWAPHDIFPAEIVAISRVRNQLGLETPQIDHPLMNTPFGNPPDTFSPVEDEFLSAAITKVRQIMPEV